MTGVPGAVRRNTRRLFLAQVMLSSGLAITPQLSSLIVYRLTGTAALAGLPAAILYIVGAAVAYPAGRLMDRRGRRTGLVLGFLTGALGAALIAAAVAAGRFAGFLAGMAVFSVGIGIGQLTRAAAADMYPAPRRAGAVGLVVTGGLIGALMAPVLVALGDRLARAVGGNSLAVPWLFAIGAFAAAAVAASRLRPDPREIGTNLAAYFPEVLVEGTDPAAVPDRSVRALIASPPVQAAMIALACAQTTMVMLMATAALMLAFHGHGLGTISLVMMAHFLGMFALSIPVGRLADRVGRYPVMIGGALLTAASGVLFPLGTYSAPWAALAFYLVGLGWCLAYVAGAALLGDLVNAGTRARVFGLSDLLTNLLAMAGALVSGVILARGGELLVGAIAAALGTVPLLAILRARRAVSLEPAPAPAAGGGGGGGGGADGR